MQGTEQSYNSKPQSGLVSLTVRHKPPVNVRYYNYEAIRRSSGSMFISSLGAESRHTHLLEALSH